MKLNKPLMTIEFRGNHRKVYIGEIWDTKTMMHLKTNYGLTYLEKQSNKLAKLQEHDTRTTWTSCWC